MYIVLRACAGRPDFRNRSLAQNDLNLQTGGSISSFSPGLSSPSSLCLILSFSFLHARQSAPRRQGAATDAESTTATAGGRGGRLHGSGGRRAQIPRQRRARSPRHWRPASMEVVVWQRQPAGAEVKQLLARARKAAARRRCPRQQRAWRQSSGPCGGRAAACGASHPSSSSASVTSSLVSFFSFLKNHWLRLSL
jgi:hypothetical protein